MVKRVLISAMIWMAGVLLTVALYLAILATVALFPFDRERRRAHAQCYWWGGAMIAANPFWKVEVSGLENIDHNKTYVIVANHQSLADIFVLYKIRMQFKWVAKESLFGIPFLGWCMALCKHIRISRGELGSIKQVYRQAAGWLRGGMSVIFFPEGTRSEDGRLKDFMNGAFKLALKERVPILPVALHGTASVISKGSRLFGTKVRSSIDVLPAIDVSGYAAADFVKLRDTARSMLAAALRKREHSRSL
ncbi:MAG: 1-acyl-sn-glycerol-3-phosphate acyltransferase [Candidatus Omnitrophica bacterium]|nr:1-acyl-sn-glycerol-3-phosphate acyltransferase [Candidatus Omnitrophota bacterium]